MKFRSIKKTKAIKQILKRVNVREREGIKVREVLKITPFVICRNECKTTRKNKKFKFSAVTIFFVLCVDETHVVALKKNSAIFLFFKNSLVDFIFIASATPFNSTLETDLFVCASEIEINCTLMSFHLIGMMLLYFFWS